MSHVRVRIQLDGVRLEYSGDQDFFDRLMDPLVDAAAARPGTGGRIPRATDAPLPSPAPRAAVPSEDADEPAREAQDRPEEDEEAGFRPRSADFGHFIRQLGEEAAEPDRQAVAFAFYLWNYEKREEFREDEVAGCFRALGLPVPEDLSEIHEDLADRRRFLDPGREAGTWSLTPKGLNYVKTRLFAHT